MKSLELAGLIRKTIIHKVNENELITRYREPVIGFLAANDPDFSNLNKWTEFKHLMPEDLLLGARAIVCFFLPFAPEITYANAKEKERVAREWAIAYHETNALIGQITCRLIELLTQLGIQGATEQATGDLD